MQSRNFKVVLLFCTLLFVSLFLSSCGGLEIDDTNNELLDNNLDDEDLDSDDNFVEVIEELEEFEDEELEINELEVEELVSDEDCEDTSTFFTYAPLDVKNLEMILPMGLMSDSHVTPVDHQYWTLVDGSEENLQEFEIIAPASGVITHVGKFTQAISDTVRSDFSSDYRFVIEHECSVETIFIHIDELSPKVMEAIDFSGSGSYLSSYINVEVEAGEVIGTVSGRSFDFSVHDYNTELTGFISSELYSGEPWKIHTVDPFDYFESSLRTSLLEKNIRVASPLGGKIDYDIAGALVGTWFKENTKGYAGVDLERYWDGHLSVAYDYLDPSLIIVSIGDYLGTSKQFAVKGNNPDPASVLVGSGVVTYELVDYDYSLLDGSHWDREGFDGELVASGNDNYVSGTVLFEVLESEQLRVEVFDGVSAAQVSGFTDAALMYER